MTPDRIAELRAHAEEYEFSRCSVLIECLEAIERLQSALAEAQTKTAIYREAMESWRDERLTAGADKLFPDLADAETRGWNAAVEAAAKPFDSGTILGKQIAGIIRAMLKPTTKEST